MKISRYLFLAVIVFGFIVWNLALANIDNLKGTYSILKDEYKHLSIIHGAIADEKDYLMKLYDYGSLGEEKDATDQSGAHHNIPDVTNAPAVVKLVHLFFHRNPGQNNRTDFVLTTKLLGALPESKQNIIKAIAWMIGTVEKAKNQKKIYQKILSDLVKITQPSVQSISDDEIGQLKGLADFKQKITDVLQKGSANPAWQGLKNFLKLVFISTSQEFGDNAVFPENTTTTVLLGIVYRLASDDKALMRIFYNKLNETIGQKDSIFVNGNIPVDWENEAFDPTQKENIAAKIKDISPENIGEIINNFESIVYFTLLPGDYPPLSGYATANYFYDKLAAKTKVSFSDCMDTTFRNFFNILFYEDGKFKLDKIPGIKIEQKMLVFYTIQSNATVIEKYHDEWTNVIENIPFVAYNRKVGSDQSADNIGKKGFIKIPGEVVNPEKFDADYQRVDANDVVYEIEPSLKNIIIATNYLLGLNLFEKEKADCENNKIAQTLLQEDFIKHYFPEMCKKIGVELISWDNGTWSQKSVDKTDYTCTTISTCFKMHTDKSNADVILSTSKGHGNVYLTEVAANKNFTINPDNFSEIKDPRLESLPYLFYSINSSYFDFKKSPNILFWLPIYNYDFVKFFLNSAFETKFVFDLNSLKLLRSLINKIPDEIIRKETMLQLKILSILNKKWDPKLGLDFLPGSDLQTLKSESQKTTKLKCCGLKYELEFVVDLYDTLLQQKDASLIESNKDQAIEIAKEGYLSKNQTNRDSATRLWESLFKNKHGVLDATNIAHEWMKSEQTKYAALLLWQTLVENEQSYSQATSAANDGMKSTYNATQKLALKLWNILIQKVQNPDVTFFDQAINAARQVEDPYCSFEALALWYHLVKKRQAFLQAIEVAQKHTYPTHYDMNNNTVVLWLWEALFEEKQGFPQAINKVTEGIKSNTYIPLKVASDLSNILIKNLKSALTSSSAPNEIELWCKKLIENMCDADIKNVQKNLIKDFQAELPSLLLKHKLIRLKTQLTELKNKLSGLKQKLTSLQATL